ncbi:hypothetical protein CR513_10029, partial [Mucuna pruriens]
MSMSKSQMYSRQMQKWCWIMGGVNQVYYKLQWVSCYMKETFTLGMRSAQLSKSLNSHFKAHIKLDVNIKQFLDTLNELLRRNVSNSDINRKSLHTLCLIYSSKSLHYFYPQAYYKEMNLPFYLNISSQGSIIKDLGKYCLIVIQSLYLAVVKDLRQLTYFVLYIESCSRQLTSKMIKLASKLSPSKEYYELVDKSIDAICKKIKEFHLKIQSNDKYNGNAPTLVVDDGT